MCLHYFKHSTLSSPPAEHQLAPPPSIFQTKGPEGTSTPSCGPHLFSHRAIGNQMYGLLILQVPSTRVCSLPHQQTDCIQLCHPILQAGSNMEGCVSIVSLKTGQQNGTHKEGGNSLEGVHKPEGGKVIIMRAALRFSSYLCIHKRQATGQLQKETNEFQICFFCCQMQGCAATFTILEKARKARGENPVANLQSSGSQSS